MEIFKKYSYGKRFWAYLLSILGLLVLGVISVTSLFSLFSNEAGEVGEIGFVISIIPFILAIILGIYFSYKMGLNWYFWTQNKDSLSVIVPGIIFLIAGAWLILIGYIVGRFTKRPNPDEKYIPKST